MSQKYNVAVLGATGLVGRQIIETLADRKFPVDQLFLLASSRSAGEDIKFRGETIEVLDVEGFDFDVLLGGLNKTLSKVRYLEFEYNWMGSWKYQSLYDAVHLLNRIGFTCYWARNNGLLLQVTNCWLQHYHVHAWSNVACINRNDRLMRSVAENMQERFLSTLALGETFHG